MSVKLFFISLLIMLIGGCMIAMEWGGDPVGFIVIGIGVFVFYISLNGFDIVDIFAVIFIVLCWVLKINFELIHDLWYMMLFMIWLFTFPIYIIAKYGKNKKEEQRVKDNLKKSIDEQFDSLLAKYEQAVSKNDYSDWHKERDCFLDDFVSKNNVSYHYLNSINCGVNTFDEYWNELVKDKNLRE